MPTPRIPLPLGWLPLLGGPAVVLLVGYANWQPWVLMWALAFTIYGGCKWLTWSQADTSAPLSRHLLYLFLWPGLDAPRFLDPAPKHLLHPTRGETLRAATLFVIGLFLFTLAPRLVFPHSPYLAAWCGMVGFMQMLHFGLANLVSVIYRSAGIDAPPLMHHPFRARTLADFWGKRWNTAFSDLTHRFLFTPLTERLGPKGGVLAGFTFSGLIHELAISIPARGGYGLPTAFFVLHGLALLFERTPAGRKIRGRAWVFLTLIPPAFLLFHPPFVYRVILPWLDAMGSL